MSTKIFIKRICLNKFVAVLGMTLVLVAAVFTFSCDAVETVVISFEQSEGFPAAGGDFTGKEIPKDIVTVWTNDSTTANMWFIDNGPDKGTTPIMYPDAPQPVTGSQIAGFSQGGHGINIGTMHLNKKANLVLTSFYWAYRGNGDSMPGGNAYLELEYFDINEKSLGKEKFQGGLAPDGSPKFELAKTSQKFQDVPLSRVIFRGVPPDPEANQHGTFFLDDVTLSLPGKKDVSEPRVSKFRQVDTTPPMVKLPQPPPDSTVRGNPIISVKFSDVGSGINVSSAKLLLDSNDVTSQAKVTVEGIMLQSGKPLIKGIHKVEVTVLDNAGNQGNRQGWRFGVDVPIVVQAKFEKGVFMVSGEPYFPMGMYAAIGTDPPYSEKNIFREEASAAGINAQLLGESVDRNSLDLSLKMGMKVMKAVSHTLSIISEQDKGQMVDMANATKDHPGMLAWWASDPDTIEKARNNMSLGYKILKENDPNHPVIWILSHRDKYKESIKSADACFVYMYPILVHNQTVKSSYDVALKSAFEAANPEGKPVWYASQEIDIRISDGQRLSSPDDFRPTPEEMRAMNYLALAKGVKGLFLYAQGGSPTPGVYNDLTEYPAQWKEAMKIASEVRYLSTVLAAGKPTQTARIEPENAAIHYGEIEHEGMKTLIAVNVADYPVTVTWRFSNLVEPVVLFEDRMLSEKAKEITDIFKPLEVHIYRWM